MFVKVGMRDHALPSSTDHLYTCLSACSIIVPASMSPSLPPELVMSARSVIDFLTTKSTEWSIRQPELNLQWIHRENGFHVELGEDDEPPLRYREHIAAASGGGVDRYHCKELNRDIAVKRLQTHSDPKSNQTLYHEVEVLRRLRHYHVVQVYGSYTHRDWFNILMTPIATCDLRTYLYAPLSHKVKLMEKSCGPRALLLPRIMGCLAHGLHYIHKDSKVRHKDIKPANILLDGPRVLYADFGCSKVYTDTQSGTTGPTTKTPMVRPSPSTSKWI